jgi:hypothetical protein
MTDDNLTGPELFEQSMAHLNDVINPASFDQDNNELLQIAQTCAINAQTAAIVMLAGIQADVHNLYRRELEVWGEVIPTPPLVECRGKEIRRPECAERHTEDCAYTDPPREADAR